MLLSQQLFGFPKKGTRCSGESPLQKTSWHKSLPGWIWSVSIKQSSTGHAQSTSYLLKKSNICESFHFEPAMTVNLFVQWAEDFSGSAELSPQPWFSPANKVAKCSWALSREEMAAFKKALLPQPLREQKSSFAHPLSIKAFHISLLQNHLCKQPFVLQQANIYMAFSCRQTRDLHFKDFLCSSPLKGFICQNQWMSGVPLNPTLCAVQSLGVTGKKVSAGQCWAEK